MELEMNRWFWAASVIMQAVYCGEEGAMPQGEALDLLVYL